MTKVCIALSTSSPMISAALILESGEVVLAESAEGQGNALNTSMKILERLRAKEGNLFASSTQFAVDLGPGSLTGARIGVTVAKTMAFARGGVVGGLLSFDLIPGTGAKFVPRTKRDYLVRSADGAISLQTEAASQAAGWSFDSQWKNYPNASEFAGKLKAFQFLSPELLLPYYFDPPLVSLPKNAFQ